MASRDGLGWVVLALGAEALFACGSAPPANTLVIDNSLNVTIYTDGKRGKAPSSIDPEDPRIGVAQGKIAQLLGHPLGFEFDAALATQLGDDLHRAYVAGLEEAAAGLVSCKKHEPEAFAYGSEVLHQVRLAYSPIAAGQPTEPRLDGSTLPIPVRLDTSRLIEGYEFCSAFKRSLSEGRADQFATIAPADVAMKDEAAYLEYIDKRPYPRKSKQEEQLGRLNRGLHMLAFYPHIEQAEVRKDANRSLGYFASELHELMASQTNDVVLLTALGKAHPAWIEWVNANGATLSESERLFLSGQLLRRRDPVGKQFTAGFDATGFGLPTVEHWLETVSPSAPRETKGPLEQCIVGPARRGDEPPKLWLDSPCRGAVYSDLTRTAKGLERLVTLLLRWHSDVLTETAMAHTLRDQGPSAALALLDALARDQKTTRVALRALAEFGSWGTEPTSEYAEQKVDPRPVVARVPAWWKSHPEHRAMLLYLLVRITEHQEGMIAWPKLAQFLGGRIDTRDLVGFLAEDPRNVWYVQELAFALSPGWPLLLVPALEVHLGAEAQRGSRHDSRHALERVIAALCENGTRQDLDAVQKAMLEYIEQYPSQSISIGPLARASATYHCPKFAAGKKAKPGKDVLFGD